jgi:tetratricopeptide (TPR) repeat protein
MIQETADNARAYFSLGVVYSKIEQPQEAVEQYHKALGITPEFKEALFNLAAGYEALGDPAQAAVYYEKMLALEGANDELDQIASQRLESIHKGLTEDGSLPETVSPNAR